MNMHRSAIDEYIETHKGEMLKKWETLVNLEGHFNEKEHVEKATDWLRKEFEAEGFDCYIEDVSPEKAGILVGTLGKGRAGKPVVFSGHIDTVHKSGSWGEAPFRIEDGKAYGPGVLDMKGGIIITLYVVKALNSIGFDERPIKIMFAGEEESDHIGNEADKFFENQSKDAICAFNMETGNIENKLCVGRKAQYTFFATVKGQGGHAGNEFHKGKNAIHEAVFKVADLMKITDMEKGTTVTTSVFHSGSNTSSIPDLCEFAVDVRISSPEEAEGMLAAVDKVLRTNYIDGTTTDYTVDIAKLRSFGPTEPVMKLFNFVNAVAVTNDYSEFGNIRLGGASDAGNIAASGISVLCSCGVIGEFNHSTREYAVVQSLFDRAKIFALTVTELKDF